MLPTSSAKAAARYAGHDSAEIAPSLNSNRTPNLASQMRVAFSSIAWNTGSSSPGELLMTLQHLRGRGLLLQCLGELARALLHLVEQPHVLDRDHRLVGEGRDQLDLLVGEWPHRLRSKR